MQSFNCNQCSMSYKTERGLNNHVVAKHPAMQNEQAQIVIVESIDTTTQVSSNSIQTQTDFTCTCKETQLSQTLQVPNQGKQSIKCFQSQGTQILDILKQGQATFALMDDFKLKAIDLVPINVLMYDKPYDYSQVCQSPQSVHISTYLNQCKLPQNQTKQHQVSNSALYSKILTESNIKYCKDFQMCFFDIETVDYRSSNKIPQPQDRNCEIRMIQWQIGSNKPVIYLNNKMAHTYEQSDVYDVVEFHSERFMCDSFIELMQQQPKQSIWISFNGSASGVMGNLSHLDVMKSRIANGYDLHWIVQRCSYYMTPINKLRKVNGRILQTTDSLAQLPQTYFLDMTEIAQAGLQEKALRELRNYSLDEYCRVYKVEQKLHSDQLDKYYVMNKCFAEHGSDITQHLHYGVQDILVLDQLATKLALSIQIQCKLEMDGLGLQATLFETINNKLQIIINRATIEQKRAPSYLKNATTPGSFKGALTGVHEDFKCKIVPRCVQNDFDALYPSVIIQNNISQDTLLKDQNEDSFNLHAYTDIKEIEMVSFQPKSERRGILPQLCIEYMKDRTTLKKAMKLQPEKSIEYKILEQRQLYVKLKMNTLYGSQGQKQSPHFNLKIAQAITAGSRIALENLRSIALKQEYVIVAHDTDAINMPLKKGQILNWETANQITDSINFELSQIYKSDTMKVSCDELMQVACFSRCKKSYARIELSTSLIESVCIKGVQWSNINPQMHNLIYDHARLILTNPSIKVSFIHNKMVQEVKLIIKNKDVCALQKYAHILKRCSKQNLVISILNQYPNITDDKLQIFYRLKRQPSDNKTSLAIPYQALVANPMLLTSIDIQDLVYRYTSNLDKIFTLEKQGKLKDKLRQFEDLEPDQIQVRVEMSPTNKCIEVFTIEQLYNAIVQNGAKYSYHECLNSQSYRFFADIDSLPNHIVDPISFIANALHELGYKQFTYSYATAHSSNKRSWHIVTNLYMNQSLALRTAELINEIAHFQLIDMKPLSGNQFASLRLPNCIKFKHESIVNRPFQIECGSFKEMLITNEEDTIKVEILPCSDKDYLVIPQNPYFNQEIQVNPQALINLKAYLEANHTNTQIKAVQGNLVTLSGQCPLSNSGSKSHGSYCTLGSSVYIKCHSANCIPFEVCKFKKSERIKTEVITQIPDKTQCEATQSNRYLQVELTHSLTAIKSSVGSGKTEQIIKHLQSTPQTAIFVTVRKCLAKDIKRRFLDNGLEAVAYDEVKGALNVQINKPLVIQYESLERVLDNIQVDTLVLDEWFSILEQISSKLGRNSDRLVKVLIQLIQKASKVVVMDGLLTIESTRILEVIKGTRVEWVCNDYLPYSDYQLDFVQNKKGSWGQYTNDVLTQLELGKKVVSFISDKNKLAFLVKAALKQNPNYVIRYIQGEGLSQDLIETSKQHYEVKEALMKDFGQIRDCDLFVYTSAITSGVDFSEKGHFDIGMHYVKLQTASANQTIQALFRIRHLNDKKHRLYYSNCQYGNEFRPYRLVKPQLSQHLESNLETIATAFTNQTNQLGHRYILQGLVDLGLTIQIIDMKECLEVSMQSEDLPNPYLRMPLEQIEPQIVEYCMEQSEFKRKEMLANHLFQGMTEVDKKVQCFYQMLSYQSAIQGIEDDLEDLDVYETGTYKFKTIIKQINTYKRLTRYTDQWIHLTEHQLGSYHTKQMQIAINAKRNSLEAKISIQDLETYQFQEKSFLRDLQATGQCKFLKAKNHAKVSDIKQIKELCRGIGRKEAISKICVKLNIPDLKVETQLKNWALLKAYFIEQNKWTETSE